MTASGVPAHHPVTAFVFAGGGGRGACQLGMLRALLEAGIVPDLVVGASVGALNGVIVAADPTLRSVARLEGIWRGLDATRLFPATRLVSLLRYTQRRRSVFPAEPLMSFIASHVPVADLAETTVPIEVILADARTGKAGWFRAGPAVALLYGTSAIPGVLPPLLYEGQEWVDGGVLHDTPVLRAAELGAERIVVLLTGTLADPLPSHERPLEALVRSMTLTKRAQLATELAIARERAEVIVLECPAGNALDALDFSQTSLLIESGLRSAERLLADYRTKTRTTPPATVASPLGALEPRG
jgi:NTE family protein